MALEKALFHNLIHGYVHNISPLPSLHHILLARCTYFLDHILKSNFSFPFVYSCNLFVMGNGSWSWSRSRIVTYNELILINSIRVHGLVLILCTRWYLTVYFLQETEQPRGSTNVTRFGKNSFTTD